MRLTLTVKLVAIILGLTLIPVAVVGIVSVQSLNDIKDNQRIVHDESLVVIAEISKALNNLSAAHESFMIYVLEYPSMEASINYNEMISYQQAFGQFLNDYENYKSLARQPHMSDLLRDAGRTDLLQQEQTLFTSIKNQYNSYEDDTNAAAALLVTNKISSAYSAAGNASGHLESINVAMADLIGIVTDASNIMDEFANQKIRTATFYTIVSATAGIAAVALATFVITSRETRPIVAVSKAAKTIAAGNFRTRLEIKAGNDEVGDLIKSMNALIENTSGPLAKLTESAEAIAAGDFSKDIDVEAKGDMAKLVTAFKLMKANMERMTRELRDASGSLRESSMLLAETINQMTQSTQHVSTSVMQAAKSAQAESSKIDEMVKMLAEQTKAIYDVVQSAQNAASASSNASEVAQTGSRSAQHSLERMSSLLKNVEETGESMKRLSKKSKEIAQIVSIITSIAHQTNLLSLNAAIEAARAGEQGRGFAVVADEVRKLAEGSRKAASQIQELIELVETDIQETTQKMEHTIADATESARTISDSLKSLEDIAATIQETAAMVEEISASTEEQKALTENLAKALDEVATIARETSSSSESVSVSTEELAAGMEEMAASAQELANLASKLNDLAKQMSSSSAAARGQDNLPSGGKPKEQGL